MGTFYLKTIKKYFFQTIQGFLRVIMNPTQLKMQPTIHICKANLDKRKNVQVAVQMYCGLHFQFRRVYYHCSLVKYLYNNCK
jgi:hypothetical protein